MYLNNAYRWLVICLAVVVGSACGTEWRAAIVLPVCPDPTTEFPGVCVAMHPCPEGQTIETLCLPQRRPATAETPNVEPGVMPDAGVVEAEAADAGELDGGLVDAGTPDAGPTASVLRITSGRFPGITGAVATVTWESSGVESVSVEVSEDSGKTWQPLPGAESLPAADGSFTYAVPRESGWQHLPQHWSVPSPLRVRVVALDVARLSSEVEADTGCAIPVVNEVQWPEQDGRGGFVELVNPSRYPISLDGFILATDIYSHTGPAPFPVGTVIPARGVLVLYDSASAPPAVPEDVLLVPAATSTVAPPSWFALDAACASYSPRSSTGLLDAYDPRLDSDRQPRALPSAAVVRTSDVYGQTFTTTATPTPGVRADGSPFNL